MCGGEILRIDEYPKGMRGVCLLLILGNQDKWVGGPVMFSDHRCYVNAGLVYSWKSDKDNVRMSSCLFGSVTSSVWIVMTNVVGRKIFIQC